MNSNTVHTSASDAIEESIHRNMTAQATPECELDLLVESEDSSDERDLDNHTITTYWGATDDGWEWSVMVVKKDG